MHRVSPWAMYASARFAASPSVTSASGSINIAVTMLEPSSMHDMMMAAVASSLRVLRMRPVRSMRIIAMLAAHQRHHRHAGFKTAQAQRQLRKENQASQHRGPQAAATTLVCHVPVAA